MHDLDHLKNQLHVYPGFDSLVICASHSAPAEYNGGLSTRFGIATMQLILSSTLLIAAGSFAQNCEDFSNEGGDYYEAISDCDGCTSHAHCGFCLSTLQCLEGDFDGPSNGSPCNYWLTSTGECPEIPQCEQLSTCGACVDMEDCAWCASEQRCLTVSEIFMTECEGSIFDAPCPSSSVHFFARPKHWGAGVLGSYAIFDAGLLL